MSGVYERNRSQSALEWVKTAHDICNEVDDLCKSEKVITKSRRITFGIRLFDYATSLSEHVRCAYNRYPNTPKGVRDRKDYLQLAIDDCYHIEDLLQR